MGLLERIFCRSRICLVFLVGAALVTSGSAVTGHVFAATQPTTSLPSCTDPTGQNLPCTIVISTLPPPAYAFQCQESSGEILPCSYATQILSNGEQIIAITVYVPINFVFGNPTIIKVVVHEPTKTIRGEGCPPFTHCVSLPPPEPSCKGIQGVHGCIIFLQGGPGFAPTPIYLTPLPFGPHTNGFKQGWFDGNTGSDSYNPYLVGSRDWLAYKLGYEQGLSKSTPYTNCEHFDTCGDPKVDPTYDPNYKPQPLPSPCISHGIDSCNTIPPAGVNPPTPSVGTRPLTTTSDCTANPNNSACQQQQQQQPQQHHTAAYLQALNSGAPNPFKPGTKDYKHYQAGLDARQQKTGSGGGSGSSGSSDGNSGGSVTSGGGSSNSGSGSSIASGGTNSGGGSESGGGGSSGSDSGGGGSDNGQSTTTTK